MPETYALECRPGKVHDFDWYSGWCRRGCGCRNDGRVVNRYGVVIHPGPEYTEADLEPHRKRLERLNSRA